MEAVCTGSFTTATTNNTGKVTNSSSKSLTRSHQAMLTPKTNHVSTVLLYGIPIVSLYIEGQERLCLAQISNTLLKQYSYNEIHNRRVALGITCVQCTPVQLEILRRAGAMPVSSRRCGMITRREAERLCKSFLGDNAPPRLPEDFAFTVYHKCAWGCRGSFLPSRYNSSRAKCIKCSYCGMYFSPNKFIFHSHRISAGDKYVQPDAANFNSWRRHMILSGQPPEEIVHAWEDVKAMFNGGTRKRLMSHSSSTTHASAAAQRQQQQDQLKRNMLLSTPVAASLTAVSNESVSGKTIVAAAQASINAQATTHYHYHGIELSPRGSSSNLTSSNSSPPPTKRQCDQHEHNVGAVTAAAAAVVGVTAVAAAVGAVRPLSIGATSHGVSYHGRTGTVSTLQLSDTSEHEMSVMPISRNFMMDYMWHAHAAQNAAVAAAHKNRSNNSSGGNVAVPFGFPDCAMHWLKTPSINNNATFFTQLPLVATSSTNGGRNGDNIEFCQQLQYGAFKPNASTPLNNGSLLNTNKEAGGLSKFAEVKTACLPQFTTASAFKPVLQQSQQNTFNAVAAVAAASATATLATASVYPNAATATAEQEIRTTQVKVPSCGPAKGDMTLPTIAFPAFNATSTTKTITAAANDAAAEAATSAAASLALSVHPNFCATAANGLLLGGPLPHPPPLPTRPNSPGTPYRTPIQPTPASTQSALKNCHNEDIGGSIKGSYSTDGENNNDAWDIDDDEMVDIETTEDDTPASKNLKVPLSVTPRPDDTENSPEYYNNNHCDNNSEQQFNEAVTDTSSDEVTAAAATAPIWTNRSETPVPRECYRSEKQLKSLLQYSHNKAVQAKGGADSDACDTVVQQLQPLAQYKSRNSQQQETCARIQHSPTYSSTSNDSFYIAAKYESNNNSSSSIEVMDTSSITQIVQQHNAYSLGSSFMWKKLLKPEDNCKLSQPVHATGRAKRAGGHQQHRKYQAQQLNNSAKTQLQEENDLLRDNKIELKTNNEKVKANEAFRVAVDDEKVDNAGKLASAVVTRTAIEMREKQMISSTDHSVREIIKSTDCTAAILTAPAKATTEAKMDAGTSCVNSSAMQLDACTKCSKAKLTVCSSNNNDSGTVNHNNNGNDTYTGCCNNTKHNNSCNNNTNNDGITSNTQFNGNKEFWNVARRLYVQCSENNEILRIQQQQQPSPQHQLHQQRHLRAQPSQRQHQQQPQQQQQQPHHHQAHSEQLQATRTQLFYSNQQQQQSQQTPLIALAKPPHPELSSLAQQYQQPHAREHFLQHLGQQQHHQVLCLDKNAPQVATTTYPAHHFRCYDSPTPTNS